MYLVPLKTTLVEAIQKTFDRDYLISEFRNLHASLEFPMERQNYPGIWVDFIQIGSLQILGVSHKEIEARPDGSAARSFTRWRFQGEATFTITALTSLERDRLHDEMIRIFAFGQESPSANDFREHIDQNDLLAVEFDWDEIAIRGNSSSLGTPWGSDDMIYEVEIAMECFGEFVADHQAMTLLPFDEVRFIPIVEGEPDPTLDDEDQGWITA